MFTCFQHNEVKTIFFGLVVLVLVVTLGINVTSWQLNNLTGRAEYIQVLSCMKDGRNTYFFFCFHRMYQINISKDLGKVYLENNKCVMESGEQKLAIPFLFSFDCSPLFIAIEHFYRKALLVIYEKKREFQHGIVRE